MTAEKAQSKRLASLMAAPAVDRSRNAAAATVRRVTREKMPQRHDHIVGVKDGRPT